MGAIVEHLAGSRAWLIERRKWLLAILGLIALVYPFIVRSYFLSLADRITVLHYGQVIAEGTPAEVRSNSLVQEIYLGVSE